MSRRKGTRIRRMAAVLLSAVLITGMLWDAVPITVQAQETDGQGGSGTETAAGDMKPEEKTETTPAEGTDSGEQEKTDSEGQEEPGTENVGETEDGDGLTDQEPGGGMEEKPQEPVDITEEEPPEPEDGTGEEPQESVSENDAESEPVAPPQRVMRAAPAPQVDIIDVGQDWTLYVDGKLTVSSDNGVASWIASREKVHNGTAYKLLVTSAEIQNGVISIGNSMFRDCSNLADIKLSGSVMSIGGYAFYGCSGLTAITIPGSVTSIGGYAFYGCSGLTAITIPEKVTSIGGYTFYDCSGLTAITIPGSVTGIGDYAFQGCSSLTSITIPKSVASIGNGVFWSCSLLADVTMLGKTPPEIEGNVFTGCEFVTKNTQGIHVPEGEAKTYKEKWTKWAAYITDGTHTHSWSSDWTTNETHHWHTCIVSDCPTTNNTEKDGYGAHAYDNDSDRECNVCGYTRHIHNDVTFTAWTQTNSLPTAAGKYCLTENVTLTDTWKVPGGETTLCLNGKTISASGTDEYRVITIPESCTLNLYDCQNAGNITNGKDGGVINFGAFHMYGGKINGNESKVSGGGVNNQGVFCMYGGEISGNRANDLGEYGSVGGGVYMGSGTFSMYGGKISGNTAKMGGGVGSLSIVGTTHIYNEPLTIGGGTVINGNTYDGKENNVCLNDGQIITIESSNPLSDSAKIGVTTKAAPNEGSPVNITGENDADYSSFFTSDNANYKIVNGEDNVVQLEGKHIHEADPVWQQDAEGHWHSCKNGCGEKLDYAVHTFVENKCNVCGCTKAPTETHAHNDVIFTAWTKTDSLPTAAGNYYLTEDVTLDNLWFVPSGETSLCLNGKNIRFAEVKEEQRAVVINIRENAALKLLNCDQSGIGGKISGGSLFGVYVSGSFYMYGGTITENGTLTALASAGVINFGTFYMYGGGIEDNRLPINGIRSAGLVNDGTFYMYGGRIVRNITDAWGAGVCNQSGKTVVIGGSAVIADNEDSDGCKNNLFLYVNDTITVDSKYPLSGSAQIGVLTDDLPEEGKPVNITGANSQDYHLNFFSDDPNYIVTDGEDHAVQLIVAPHTHKLTRVDAKPATCTEGGKKAYYHCEGCDKYYEDAEGSSVISDISAWGNIAALGHDWGEWTVTKAATATTPGEKERTCKRCKEKETEIIPKTGGGSKPGGGSGGDDDHSGDSGNSDGGNNNNDNGGGTGSGTPGKPGAPGTGQPKVKQEKVGNIRKEVRVEGEETLDAEVKTPLSELADIVLTKEEKQKAAGGTDVKIVLNVKDASAVVSAADKALVEKALNGSPAKGYTLGQYLDISLFKVIGDSRSAITETNRKITITIDVPDSLKNTDSTMTRTFAVIRVHDGKAELLADLDDNADTITIETDRFSTYAVVYKDTAGGNGKPGVARVSAKSDSQNPGGGQESEPKTGDGMPIELCATLSMIAGFAYLLLYFADRERGMTEETKKELVSRLIAWAKQGGRCRTYLALAAIFLLLVYYHSIGKKAGVKWKEVYGE